MLGMVYTELQRYVELHHGADALDDVLDAAALPHGGAYTAVGNYPHEEILRIVGAAAGALDADPQALLRHFGHDLFGRFHTLYPDFFKDVDSSLAFLERIEDHIHHEVRKLYEASNPPLLTAQADGADLIVEYVSHRPLAALALGLIEGCLEHFAEGHRVERLDGDSGDAHRARFIVRAAPSRAPQTAPGA